MAEKGTVVVRFVGDVKELSGSLLEAEGGLGKFKTAALGGFAVVSAAAVGVAVGLFELGEKFETAYKKIRVGTGATGEALKGLEDSFKKVLASGPSSMNDVSAAITIVNQKLGLTGKPLEDMTTQLLRLSRLTGTDLTANVQAATGMFNNWNVASKDQAGTLDLLFRASQKSGVSVETLASEMGGSGVKLREAGLSIGESASLIALLGKNGIEASTVMMPLGKAIAHAAKEGVDAGSFVKKTFTDIRTESEKLGNSEALKVFGAKGIAMAGMIREGKLSYDDFLKTIASGDTIAKAAADTATFGGKLKTLKNMISVALEPLAMTVVDFVTKAMSKFMEWAKSFNEEVAPKIADFAKKVAGYLEKLQEKIDPLVKALEPVISFLKDHLQPILIALAAAFAILLGAAAIGGVITILGMLVGALTSPIVLFAALVAGVVYAYQHFKTFRDVVDTVARFLMNTVLPAIEKVARYLIEQFGHAIDWVKRMWPQISEAIGHVMTVIRDVIGAAIAVISYLWDHWGGSILNMAKTAWDLVKTTISNAIRAVQDVIKVVLDLINGDWGKAWDALKDLAATIWNQIKADIKADIMVVVDILGGFGSELKSAVSDVYDVLVSPFKTAFKEIKRLWDDGPGKLVSAASAVGGVIGGGVDKVAGSMFGHVGVPGGATGFKNFPGGLALVGEDGPEIVHMPRGADLYPNGTGPPGMGGHTFNITSNADPMTLSRELMWQLGRAM